MNKHGRTYCMWCLGLGTAEIEQLRAGIGRLHHLVVLSEESLPTLEDADRDEPVLVWIGQRFWDRMRQLPAGFHFMEHLSRVLVLSSSATRADLEAGINGGFQDVLIEPLTRERIYEVIRRSLEISNIHEDFERMTRELLLNRELLMRKEDVFAFLQQFVSKVSKCMGTEEILAEARNVLSEILPVESMHLAVWKQETEKIAVQMFLDVPESPGSQPCAKAWSDLLLSTAGTLVPGQSGNWHLTTHYTHSMEYAASAPDSRKTLLLLLCSGGIFCGVVALFLREECTLGRDQAVALDAAMNHLALTLQSSIRAPRAVSVVSVGEVVQMAAVQH